MNANGEVTTREAAERLGVSQRTVTRYIQGGKLTARRVTATGRSGVFVIPVGDLEAFSARRADGAPAPRLSDEHLADVATRYELAVEGGEHPRHVLATHYGKSANTVDGWISAARRRGFLPAYVRGSNNATVSAVD